MDYKLELQNNNADINNNNIDLNTILESINALPNASGSGGIDTSDATATSTDIASGKTAYVDGEKIVGAIQEISSDESFALDDVAAYNGSGFIAAKISGVAQQDTLLRKNATVYANFSDMYEFGDAHEGDVLAGKTFSSVAGFKKLGTHVCAGGTDTSDATATEADILSGKTAYINGGKVTGTLVVNSYYTGDVEPDNSFGNDGDLYFVRGE